VITVVPAVTSYRRRERMAARRSEGVGAD